MGLICIAGGHIRIMWKEIGGHFVQADILGHFLKKIGGHLRMSDI
jgi:hypothetical protein